MGMTFAQVLLLSLATGVSGGVGSASQVNPPDSNGAQSLSGITDSTAVIYQETDGRDISNPINESAGASVIALEDSQKFVIESRKYSSELSSGETSNSQSIHLAQLKPHSPYSRRTTTP